MNADTWAKMPTGWIRHGELARFAMRAPGTSTPVLKLYIYLAGHACAPQPKIGATGMCAVTYSRMVAECGLSRGAIGPALEILDPLVSRRSGKGREPNMYTVRNFSPNGGWAPLPIGYLVRGRMLEQFGARSRTDLAALKTLPGSARVPGERIGALKHWLREDHAIRGDDAERRRSRRLASHSSRHDFRGSETACRGGPAGKRDDAESLSGLRITASRRPLELT